MPDGAFSADAIPLEVTGSLNHPETGDKLFVERGRMLALVTDSGERAYLALAALPRELLGADSPFMFHARIINQEPVIPVTTNLTDGAGCEISLKPEFFSREREINQNYHILAKAVVGPVEYALAENPKSRFFVTWERTPANDKGGEPNYYWGHYHSDRDKALSDFRNRVREKCAELAEDRKPSIRRQLAAGFPSRQPNAGRTHAREAVL